MTDIDDDTDDTIENADLESPGGFTPFAQTPQWVLLNSSPNAAVIYGWIWTYTDPNNEGRRVAFPSRETIAKGALKTTQARSVDRYIRELVHIGAMHKRQRRNSTNLHIRNVYRLQWAPPPGFTGPTTKKQWEEMGCPLGEMVPIYLPKADGKLAKKPAYTVVRYSAPRADQAKHSETTNQETDKTENPRSDRCAPERTSKCAQAHPRSAPERTGSRTTSSITTPTTAPPTPPNPDPPAMPVVPVDGGGGGSGGDRWEEARQILRQSLSETDRHRANGDRRTGALLEQISVMLTGGVAVNVIIRELSESTDGVTHLVSALQGRLSRLSDAGVTETLDHGLLPPQRSAEGPPAPQWCGRCSHDMSSNRSSWRREILDNGRYGEECRRCHPTRVSDQHHAESKV